MRILLTLLLFTTFPAFAQTAIPTAPEPIQNLAADGAQIRFLGNEHGVDAWMTMKNGQEQYFYVLPNGKAFLMGVLFDDKGKVVTVDQVRRLRSGGDPLVDALAEREKFTADVQTDTKFQTPAEQMFRTVSESNWIALGQSDAPVAYAFVDPRCPHCHSFVKDMQADIDAGKIQVRLIPVGVLGRDSVSQSAFLLAAPNPAQRWMDHMSDDPAKALPVKEGLSEQGVMRNMQIMQSWKMDATPIVVYRDKQDSVKIIRGKPKDSAAFINDIGRGV